MFLLPLSLSISAISTPPSCYSVPIAELSLSGIPISFQNSAWRSHVVPDLIWLLPEAEPRRASLALVHGHGRVENYGQMGFANPESAGTAGDAVGLDGVGEESGVAAAADAVGPAAAEEVAHGLSIGAAEWIDRCCLQCGWMHIPDAGSASKAGWQYLLGHDSRDLTYLCGCCCWCPQGE